MPEPIVPDHQRLAAMRRSYTLGGLEERDLAPTWSAMLSRWLDDAEAGGVREPNAMVVATADPAGRPGLRTVLLKGLDDTSLTFFTNYESAKGRELAANPVASILFPWTDLQRQVRLTGAVRRLDAAASDAYFDSRPYGSRLSAWASDQSRPAPDRASLEAKRAEALARFPEDGHEEVPVPDFWGGWRIECDEVEFWAGRRNRLHDRIVFTRTGPGDLADASSWTMSRRQP